MKIYQNSINSAAFLISMANLHTSLIYHIRVSTRLHFVKQNGNFLRSINPKRAGGGGGAESAPPRRFARAPRAFMTLFFDVLCNFWRYFRKNWAYGSKVTQHYVIERRLKI